MQLDKSGFVRELHQTDYGHKEATRFDFVCARWTFFKVRDLTRR